jgi:hypothetical protein
MEKSTPDLVADQQSLQGAVHFLLWKTLVAQMCRDPAKICTHPKKHHLAQCQSMFKRTLESTTSTKTCTCIPAGLNCNTDQTFKLFTQKPPEHHNGYVFLFFATTRIKHQWNQLRPMFLLFATRIKHQQNQFRPRVFVFFSQQQESNINATNLHPCFCIFSIFATRIKYQQKQLRPMFLFFCNNKNQTSTKAIETHVFVLLQQQESNINSLSNCGLNCNNNKNSLRVATAAGDLEQGPRHICCGQQHRLHKVLACK